MGVMGKIKETQKSGTVSLKGSDVEAEARHPGAELL